MAKNVLIGLVLVAGCSGDGEGEQVRFADLDEGDVIGGPQETAIDSDIALGALRVDLFLNDERIGSAEFAPFVVEWNTTGFDEGEAELRARVYVGSGAAGSDESTVDTSISVVIDNTPPEVIGLPDNVRAGEGVSVSVSDLHRIVLVELSGPAGVIETWEAPPFRLTWEADCGSTDYVITAVDEAGWVTIESDQVQTSRVDDDDCDGFLAVIGDEDDDCDDTDPAVYPGAPDEGPAGDTNCDGVPGVDADGDRVASLETGGRDCDDSDASIRPNAVIYRPEPLLVDGEPLEWEAGTASILSTFEAGVLSTFVAINRGGTVELVTTSNGTTTRETVDIMATAGPDLVAVEKRGEDLLVFDAHQRLLTAWVKRAGRWVSEAVLGTEDPIEQVVVFKRPLAELTVAVRAGASIYLARHDGEQWEQRTVIFEPAIAPVPIHLQVVGIDQPFVNYTITYLAGSQVIRATLTWDEAPILFPESFVPDASQVVGLCTDVAGEVFYAAGACLYRSDTLSGPVAPCGAPIERMLCNGQDIYIQPSNGVALHFNTEDNSVEYISAVADTVHFGGSGPDVFASPGELAWPYEYVYSEPDPLDGVDRDCDGLD